MRVTTTTTMRRKVTTTTRSVFFDPAGLGIMIDNPPAATHPNDEDGLLSAQREASPPPYHSSSLGDHVCLARPIITKTGIFKKSMTLPLTLCRGTQAQDARGLWKPLPPLDAEATVDYDIVNTACTLPNWCKLYWVTHSRLVGRYSMAADGSASMPHVDFQLSLHYVARSGPGTKLRLQALVVTPQNWGDVVGMLRSSDIVEAGLGAVWFESEDRSLSTRRAQEIEKTSARSGVEVRNGTGECPKGQGRRGWFGWFR